MDTEFSYRDDFELLQPTVDTSSTDSSSSSSRSITETRDTCPRRSIRNRHPSNRFQGLVYY